jgi:hypothetical protein
MSTHYEVVMQYIDDITDFIGSQGSHGELRYMHLNSQRPSRMTWAEFISDAMYVNEVRQALELVLQKPCTETVQKFNHACKVYIIETWMDAVVEYDLGA